MTKYSIDFKIKVINEYFRGMGSTSLCHKYHIPSKKTVLNWVHHYQTNGLSGIKNHDQRAECFTLHFKLKVLKWMEENHSSLEITACHFTIYSPSTIYQWNQRYRSKGVDGLISKRGRPPMGKHKKTDEKIQKNSIKVNQNQLQTDAERLKELEKENELLVLRMST